MKRIRTCKNKCIFCFISQLPENLRPTLYIRDDDYLESYTKGNFITLTNITGEDLEKIIKYRIEPLHVSIHSFSCSVRKILFGTKKNISAIENFYKLDSAGIRTNIQIVLCPGINDGSDLENTLSKLIGDFKNLLSIGIVPVGITRYNKSSLLKAYNSRMSSDLIDYIGSFKLRNRKNRVAKRIYLSDEFYLIAGKPFPSYESYGKFLQLQNGIGKSVDFLNDFWKVALKKSKSYFYQEMHGASIPEKKILIITSEYGEKILKMAFSLYDSLHTGFKALKFAEIAAVKNNFFAGNVKVTGLLAGNDIIDKIKSFNSIKYEKILIPGVIFNKDGLTIDNLNIEDFTRLNRNIFPVSDNGRSFYNAVWIGKHEKNIAVVAVVGKPNAGKSTLINRICNKVEAIVHKEPMITRDRKYYLTDWDGTGFYMLDTPGIDIKSETRLSAAVFRQTSTAIEESDIVIFLVDIKAQVSPLDEEIADILRKSNKPVVFAGNKWDDPGGTYFTEDYLRLGFGLPVELSANHGLNITELLDKVAAIARKLYSIVRDTVQSESEDEETPNISILGQPNVGKSTLFNSLLKEERVIVDEIEGTTRDSIDSVIRYSGKNYRFIDTAGLKKDKPREEDLDYYSKLRTLRSIEKSQVCLVLIDVLKEMTNQDEKILQTCLEKGASVCAVFNKIDATDPGDLKKQVDDFNFRIDYMKYVPVLRVSALRGKGVEKIFGMIDSLIEERNKKIPDHKLNELFSGTEQTEGIYLKGRKFKIKFIKQVKTSPPGFIVFSNMDISRKNNIKRFIEYRIRDEFGFKGTPLFFKYKH